MKIALLVTVCLLLFTSCSPASPYPTDDTYHFETDSQYTFYTQAGFRNFAEAENGYYFTLTINGFSYIFFTDKETMQTIPLCSKPNCLHYNEKDSEQRALCNAYISGLDYEAAIFYTNQKVYTFQNQNDSHFDLIELTPDGTSRKTAISLSSLKNSYTGDGVVIHRGHLYLLTSYYDENRNTEINIWQYSLDKPESKPKSIYTLTRKDSPVAMDLKAFGNHLYFMIWDGTMSYYQVDVRNAKVTQIFDIAQVQSPEIYDQNFNIAILGTTLINELIHMDMSAPNNSATFSTIYTANLDGSHIQKWIEVENDPYTADQKYFYRWTMWSGGKLLSESPHIRIYNKEGDLLVDHDPLQDIPDYRDIYVSPGEHVFIYSPQKVYYFSKEEIETGEIHPKLLIDCSSTS